MSKKLTTAAGCPVVDNQNVMTAAQGVAVALGIAPGEIG